MIGAAEVVADGHESASSLRSHGNFNGLARGNFFVELERAQEEAVGDVFAVQTELYGLPFFQGNLVGREGEALGGDFDDRDVVGVSAVGSGGDH